MKKVVSLILIILIFLPLNSIFAENNSNLNVSIDSNICGEISSIQLSFNSLPFIFDSENTVVVNFPIGFTLPQSMPLNSVVIDYEQAPLYLNITSNSILLKIRANKKDSLVITFLKSAMIRNPLSSEEDYRILIFFEEKKFFIESNSIVFSSPKNSILLEKGVKTIASSGWIPEKFDLKLSSNLATEIYYSLDEAPYSLYKTSIRITNGIHTIKYFGIRSNGAKESVNSTTYYVDSVAPSVKLINPPDGSFINELSRELVFFVEDFSPVTVLLGDNKTSVNNSGIARIKVALKPGENKLEAIAIDSANYKTYLSFIIFVDITPPTLVIFSPKKGERICSDTVEIIGKAEIGSYVFLENYKLKTDAYGNFNFRFLPKAGKNNIKVGAIDKAGNETVFELEFFVTKAKIIEYFIGKNKAIVDGMEKEIVPSPFIDSKSKEAYVSLRFTATNLGFKLTWIDKESYAILSFYGREAIIKPNDNVIRIKTPSSDNGIALKNPPTIFEGSIVIPVEFLNKVLLGEVIYDNNEGRIISKFCLQGSD